MRPIPLFVISVTMILAGGSVQAAPAACQSVQLGAVAKLCNAVLQCEAKALKQSAAPLADNACLQQPKAAFLNAYGKTLTKEGDCLFVEEADGVLPQWLADIHETNGSVAALLREGVEDSPAARTLHAGLLTQAGKTCGETLAAYAEHAKQPDDAKLESRLDKARQKFTAAGDKLIAKAAAKGYGYHGNTTASVFERIVSLAEQRQSETAGNGGVPQATAVGEPTAAKVTAEIGPDGGTLSSSDGLVTLTVPAGAVAGNTVFAVQPIGNHSPGAYRQAYRFEPDGGTFSRPLTVTMRYDPAETAPRNVGIAYQDQQGYWHSVSESADIDESARTVSFEITHFSDWAFYQRWSIDPGKARLAVGEERILKAMETRPGDDGTLGIALGGNADVKAWYVNGIKNGNATVGTTSELLSNPTVLYTAPGSVPVQNPVEVAAEIDTHAAGAGQLLVMSQITIIPNWTGYLKYELAMAGSGDEMIEGKRVVSNLSLNYAVTYPLSSVLFESSRVFGFEPGVPTVQGGSDYRYDSYDGDCVDHYAETVSFTEPVIPPIPNTAVNAVTLAIDPKTRLVQLAPGYGAGGYVGEVKQVGTEVTTWCGNSSSVAIDDTYQLGRDLPSLDTLEFTGEVSADGKHLHGKTSVPVTLDWFGEGSITGTYTVSWDFTKNSH